jgi:hypothetical protein
MDIGMEERGKYATTPAPAGGTQERLVVRGADDLHVLGRFMRALLLNFLREPRKVKAIEKLDLVVAMDPTGHPDSALTMTFRGGHVTLEGGVAPKPDIVLRCEPAVLMKLARMPAGPAAIKFLRTHEGKDIMARMRSGELRIKGIARHPLGMMKFSKFLAPSAG